MADGDPVYGFSEKDIERIAKAVRAYEREPRNRETPARVNSRPGKVSPAVVMGYLVEDLEPFGCADIALWRPGTGFASCDKETYEDSSSDDYPDDHLPPNYPDVSDFGYATVISPDENICGTKGDLVAAFAMGLGDPDETLALWIAFWTPCLGACIAGNSSGSGSLTTQPPQDSPSGGGGDGDFGDGGGGGCTGYCIYQFISNDWQLMANRCNASGNWTCVCPGKPSGAGYQWQQVRLDCIGTELEAGGNGAL